jgi:hypothetical protein
VRASCVPAGLLRSDAQEDGSGFEPAMLAALKAASSRVEEVCACHHAGRAPVRQPISASAKL